MVHGPPPRVEQEDAGGGVRGRDELSHHTGTLCTRGLLRGGAQPAAEPGALRLGMDRDLDVGADRDRVADDRAGGIAGHACGVGEHDVLPLRAHIRGGHLGDPEVSRLARTQQHGDGVRIVGGRRSERVARGQRYVHRERQYLC